MKPTTIRALAVLGGATLISVGVGLIYLPAGVIVGGLFLFVLGVVGHLRAAPAAEVKQ